MLNTMLAAMPEALSPAVRRASRYAALAVASTFLCASQPSAQESVAPPTSSAPMAAPATESVGAPLQQQQPAPPSGPPASAEPADAKATAAAPTPAPAYVDDEDLPKKPVVVARPAAPAGVTKEQLPHNLSPWGMFLAADIVVKAVMIALAIASVLVWTAWLGKLVQVALSRRKAGTRMRAIDEAQTISAAAHLVAGRRDPVAVMVREAMRELDLSDNGGLGAEGIKERVASRLSRVEAAAGRAMNAGTGLLATVGGTAPFIGLFGTVWGIMNSFIGISKAQTTNLAVVAPGIAEALLATAIGLVAAIPAVIFYNQLARAVSGYKATLADAASVIERHVSRDLDRQRHARTFSIRAAG